MQHYMLKCVYDRENDQTCIFLIDHWFPYARVNSICMYGNQLALSTTLVGSMVFTRMINKLALSRAQIRSMVFTCMVYKLALLTAQVGSNVFTCMLYELALSTIELGSMIFRFMVNESAFVDSISRVNCIYMYRTELTLSTAQVG